MCSRVPTARFLAVLLPSPMSAPFPMAITPADYFMIIRTIRPPQAERDSLRCWADNSWVPIMSRGSYEVRPSARATNSAGGLAYDESPRADRRAAETSRRQCTLLSLTSAHQAPNEGQRRPKTQHRYRQSTV